MMSNRWVVHKFGGTSVGTAESMKKCVEIIRPFTSTQRVAVVVSAMGGKPKVTDLLLDMVHAAAGGRTQEIVEKMDLIMSKHRTCIAELLYKTPETHATILQQIESDLKDISDLLKAVSLMRMAHDQILELVSGYGEVWSATIMATAMRQEGMPFKFLNAREVLFVDEMTKVYWDESEEKLVKFIEEAEKEFATATNDTVPVPPHLLITGYVASTMDGVATTLKRDGSDYSASIFGRMLKSASITIWTDVSGVFSADPRRVPEAQILPDVSYTEAIELAYFGAKVIHPKTMEPAIQSKIPIYIRNTFFPEHEGTRIYLPNPSEQIKVRERSVCGFTTVDGIALLNIEGTGVLGVPGIAHRLFGALHADNITVMFIAQASSEHSICFATHSVNTSRARVAIENAFFYEIKHGMIGNIRIIEGCSIIAAVGERMHQLPGVSGLFFGALGDASINVLSISQGCDERNISAVVYSCDATRALRAVHASFWLSSLELSIGIVGTGRVGSALLQGLLEHLELLEDRLGIKLKIRGVCNSRKMLLGEDLSDSLKEILSFFNPEATATSRTSSAASLHSDAVRKSESHRSLQELEIAMSETSDDKLDTDLDVFLQHIKGGPTPHTIMVDVSSSYEVGERHPSWLAARSHIVTANKRALSAGLGLYNELNEQVRSSHHTYMSEVTIGASLPIRTTLNDILCSGDAVHAIVGLMSVSLNEVMSGICEEGLTFTDSLMRTYNEGLFEDDTFVDLEGLDVAEKSLILARELGYALEIEDLTTQPLARRREIHSWENITNEFAAEDKDLADKARAAAAKGCTLRYVQRITCDPPAVLGRRSHESKISVTAQLEEVELGSAHAMVKGAVYHFSFHTDRYSQTPLIVQGPLSDPANTASGIVGDILRIARSVGAKDRGPAVLSQKSSTVPAGNK
mmetsp:Transcript_13662/g.22791  ORF Transcript_13662/g.22791 Transcript_13662/m.22791 type:complete len:919 (+) Transcript_13662:124-2880(+)